MEMQRRIKTTNWDLYDTRNVVYETMGLTAAELEAGYWWAYKEFYSWNNIFKASSIHESTKHKLKHFMYSGGWKKFEPIWNFLIKTGNLNNMLPVLESILSKVGSQKPTTSEELTLSSTIQNKTLC
jgi:hypothetical protein